MPIRLNWQRTEGAPIAPEMVEQGAEPCFVSNCRSLAGLQCSYIDDGASECKTAWCPEHRVMVGEHSYCRRHGALVPTLQAGEQLPFVNDRSANMVNRVADLLHQRIGFILASEGGNYPDLDVATTPTRICAYSGTRPVWGRSWALMNGRGRVILEVEVRACAALGDRLEVLVGGDVVYEEAPPWPALRQDGPEADAKAFISAVVNGVRRAAREAVIAGR